MINVKHLYKSIGKTSILKDVSLHIGEGEVVGLLGPNGAGKSTLMKVITGLWQADAGRVDVCGVDVLGHPDDVHRHIGYLPEQNPLYADRYVRESKKSEVRNPKSELSSVMDQVGLMPEADKRIHQLSKGYKQRVGLAAAMLGNPEVLILDEPTTGLDPNQLDDIRSLIRNLGKNHTIILSTHILQEVKAICSRVIIINHGQICLDEPLIAIPDLESTFKTVTLNA